MRGALRNFLDSYTSRYSDHRGYWLFGFLVPVLDELRIDLLAQHDTLSDAPFDVARRSAAVRFADQVQKTGLSRALISQAWLTIRKLPGAITSSIDGHLRTGHEISFSAEAVTDDGRRLELEKVLFVAPHDPALERRSTRRA